MIFVCVPTPITESKDPDLGPVLSAAALIRRQPPARPADRSSSRRPSRARRPGRSATVLEAGGLMRRPRLRPRLRARAGQPGRSGAAHREDVPAARRRRRRPRRRPAPPRCLRRINDHVVELSLARRRGAGQAPRERLPQREHRPGQPAGPAVRADGHRRLGGHRRRGDQAVRVHAVHARARASAGTASRSTRTTCRGARASSTSSTGSSSSPATSTCAMPRHVVDLVAEALNDRGRARQGRAGRRPRRGVQAERPRRPQLARRRRHRPGSPERGGDVGYHDPHVPRFRDRRRRESDQPAARRRSSATATSWSS